MRVLHVCLPRPHPAGSIFPRRQAAEPGEEGKNHRMNTTIIEVRTSPHLHAPRSVEMIMRNVVYALLPLCAYSVWLFGISALAVIVVALASCVLTEHIGCKLTGRESTIGDFSAVITGLL